MVITDNQLIGNSSYSNGNTVIMERRAEQAKASGESAISEKQASKSNTNDIAVIYERSNQSNMKMVNAIKDKRKRVLGGDMKQRVSILYLCFLLCFFCGACGKGDMKENNNVPVITTEVNEDLMENDSSCQELDILQQNEESVNEQKLYVGEYNSYDVNEPGLQIRKNNDGTYLIQIGIYRLTQLDNCVGVEIDNRIEFSTNEWGEGREITGTITVDNDIATVKLQAEWSDTWFKDICEYKYYKISDIPNIYVYDSTEEVTDDVKEGITASENVTDDLIINELEKLAGEYEYLSDYGAGKLIIEKNEYTYDISDYDSESSYRFLADSSNIESIENNRIYIKYPEQVFHDDTVIFCYYILEYGEDEMDVYYKQSEQTDEQLLYHATKKN